MPGAMSLLKVLIDLKSVRSAWENCREKRERDTKQKKATTYHCSAFHHHTFGQLSYRPLQIWSWRSPLALPAAANPFECPVRKSLLAFLWRPSMKNVIAFVWRWVFDSDLMWVISFEHPANIYNQIKINVWVLVSWKIGWKVLSQWIC